MSSIFAALPRHNAPIFDPAGYRAAVADVATRFTGEEITAAIADCQRTLAASHGVEFDDQRARHKTGCALTALQVALALRIQEDTK